MIKNFLHSYSTLNLLILSTFLLVFGCKTEKHKIDVSNIEIAAEVKRFDSDLFALDTITANDFAQFQNKYGDFFDLFNQRLNPFPPKEDTIGLIKLNRFRSDKDIQYLKTVSDSVHDNFEHIEKELLKFWKHYHYYFPDKIIPEMVAYISDFSYNIVALDSVIGISLNMYFGTEWQPYKSLQIEQYRVKKMTPDRIAFDVAKGWITSEYVESNVKTEFISQMLYQGKLLYFMDTMFPDAKDHEKIGYDEAQWNWMQQNESGVWAFFIENDMLYKTQLTDFMKFIHDGNSTSGFPAEAPAQMGSYIGWQIIKAYMNKNSDVSLADLMDETDVNKILKKANYKPKK